jgi:hypothetical protein
VFFKFPLLVAAAGLADRALAVNSGTAIYPVASSGGAANDCFGPKVSDPYRWLEDIDSPPTQAWMAAQNKLTAHQSRCSVPAHHRHRYARATAQARLCPAFSQILNVQHPTSNAQHRMKPTTSVVHRLRICAGS